jgi:hypothetical protein
MRGNSSDCRGPPARNGDGARNNVDIGVSDGSSTPGRAKRGDETFGMVSKYCLEVILLQQPFTLLPLLIPLDRIDESNEFVHKACSLY